MRSVAAWHRDESGAMPILSFACLELPCSRQNGNCRDKFPSPAPSNFGTLKQSGGMRKQKRYTMRQASANMAGSRKKSRTWERASIRIILLALVSFLLGVAATALWFHLAAKRNVENPDLQTSSQPSAGQPVEPMVNAPSPAQHAVANPPPADPTVIEEVKRAVPDIAFVSVEEGTRILREAAFKEFASAAKEMDVQVQQAQQQLVQAENGQSEAKQQAAMKNLQQAQTAQAEKLQQIAARLQAQIAALEQLKAATQ
jgi:cytoskeletal protein RodZ